MRGRGIKSTVMIALFAAVICICSLISIPILSVPITLQTFAIPMTLFILGGLRGLCSVAVYIAIGAIGLPVFSGFSGGVGALFGATGGFIIGFLLIGAVYTALTAVFGKGKRMRLCAYALGHLLMYALGAIWFYVGFSSGSSFIEVLTVVILPYIIPDIVKVLLAYAISQKLRKGLKI